MGRLFVDTAVFVYADGKPDRYRAPCRRLIELAADGELELEAGVDLIQEYVHVRLRAGKERHEVLARARRLALLCRLHPHGPPLVAPTLDLLEAHERLDPRDAVFAATALADGLRLIVSPDRDFDGIDGLTRVDPLDLETVEALATAE